MISPEILFENEHLIGINKPAGLVVHSGVGIKTEDTLVEWILKNYPELKNIGEDHLDKTTGEKIIRPGIVHRLDKDTSGVMVLAKTPEAYHELKTFFKKGKIIKEYRAFVYGILKKTRGTINKPIGRSSKSFNQQTTSNIRGEAREALTEYVVSAYCGTATFLRMYPRTGRMHQLRVHMKSLQSPIVCDTLYAKNREPLLGFNRLALHSYKIKIPFHTEEEPITIIAPYPDDFKNAIKVCEMKKYDKTDKVS